MGDVLRLARVHNVAIAAAGVLAGGWIGLGRLETPALLWWAAVSAAALAAAGYVANDLADTAADVVNRPTAERPLASGRVRRGTGHLVVVVGSLGGLAAAGLVSGTQTLVASGALAAMLAYSPLLKQRGLPGNLAVAALAGLPLYYGALAVGGGAAGIVPWVLAAWLHLMREVVKDVEDEAGDRIVGRRTLPIAVGRRPAEMVAAGIGLLFIPGSLLLPYRAGYGGAYFMGALMAQLAVMLAATWLVLGRVERVSRLLKAAMVIGLVALVAGRVA